VEIEDVRARGEDVKDEGECEIVEEDEEQYLRSLMPNKLLAGSC
jgi:hypothetical protein